MFKRFRFLLFILGMLTSLTACGGDSESAQTQQAFDETRDVVASDGALIIAGNISLSIPPAALEDDIEVTVRLNADEVPDGAVSPLVQIEPGEHTLTEPALIAVAVETPIADYVLVRVDGDTLIPLQNNYVDTIASEVQAEVQRFGTFAVVDRRTGVAVAAAEYPPIVSEPPATVPQPPTADNPEAFDFDAVAAQPAPTVIAGRWNGQGEYNGITLDLQADRFTIEQAGTTLRQGTYQLQGDRMLMTDTSGVTENAGFEVNGDALFLYTQTNTIEWQRVEEAIAQTDFFKGEPATSPTPVQQQSEAQSSPQQEQRGGFLGGLGSRLKNITDRAVGGIRNVGSRIGETVGGQPPATESTDQRVDQRRTNAGPTDYSALTANLTGSPMPDGPNGLCVVSPEEVQAITGQPMVVSYSGAQLDRPAKQASCDFRDANGVGIEFEAQFFHRSNGRANWDRKKENPTFWQHNYVSGIGDDARWKFIPNGSILEAEAIVGQSTIVLRWRGNERYNTVPVESDHQALLQLLNTWFSRLQQAG